VLIAEVRHLFHRTRIRVLLGVLFLLPVLLAVAVAVSGGPSGRGGGGGPAFINRVSHNGVFAALVGLTVSVTFFLPITVAVVAGDTLAGEASLGTLRYLLTRPSGRVRLLAVKAFTVALYCLAATGAIVAGGLIAGAILFPLGPVISLSGTTLSLGDGIARTLLAGLVVAVSMYGIAAIGMWASTLSDVPVGAMAATAGLIILSTVLDNIPQVAWLHPWLFTHDWESFADLLRTPILWHSIGRDLLLQAAYLAVFGAAAWARFTTRDVLA
jgi:ABC-2 type transport system permease protein